MSLLSVKNLHVCFRTHAGVVHALRGVDIDLYAGDIIGIVGESGCGKTVTASAVMLRWKRQTGRRLSKMILLIKWMY